MHPRTRTSFLTLGPGLRAKAASVPDLVGELRQLDPLDILLAVIVEQAQRWGKKGEIHPEASPEG